MYKVSFTKWAYNAIDEYALHYRKYFEALYQDTWIWEEEKIVNNYIIESEEKYFQIADTIEERLWIYFHHIQIIKQLSSGEQRFF